jgi:hypothetical protein
MTYYFCHDLLLSFGGPRGIRTLDLLNAIETRSQLRYGPNIQFFCGSGPEGIRTPGLLSAIEARSQLRYRPVPSQDTFLGRTVFYFKRGRMSSSRRGRRRPARRVKKHRHRATQCTRKNKAEIAGVRSRRSETGRRSTTGAHSRASRAGPSRGPRPGRQARHGRKGLRAKKGQGKDKVRTQSVNYE